MVKKRLPGLRFTVQYRDGLRWYTCKTYPPTQPKYLGDNTDMGYALARKVAEMIARERKMPARVLLMPGNVLAEAFKC